MHMLHVEIICFLASYLVAFVLELGRLFGRSSISRFVMVGFGVAGFVAHTLYLINRSQQTHLPPLLASTHDWMLVLAWVLVLFYVFLTLAQKELAVGVFALPVVLALVGIATLLNQESDVIEVSAARAHRAWAMFHTASLVFGMSAGAAGFLSGIMYLIQHRRLKGRHGEQTGLKMPSLARLAQMNRWAIMLTFLFLTLGFASGVILKVIASEQASPVRFGDPIVVGSLFVWLCLAGAFVWLLSGQASAGRQVAWLTLAGCGFLLITVVGLLLVTGTIHSRSSPGSSGLLDQRGSGPGLFACLQGGIPQWPPSCVAG
ncbi:MAG: cytochrome c biogenesis protein CcsA [Planctomycetes bacterium]|nr:cytochrome c biogenesis protein CcsA [Planctomycetota bacterium]